MVEPGASARCPGCRTIVQVEARYAHGDQFQCGNCGAGLKVARKAETLRLVIADPGPLRDELRALQQRILGYESDLRRAKASWGIGVNGLGLGLLYVLAKVALERAPLTHELLWTAAGLAVATGVLLELANFLFLAKRQAIRRLSEDIREARSAARELQQKIRDSARI